MRASRHDGSNSASKAVAMLVHFMPLMVLRSHGRVHNVASADSWGDARSDFMRQRAFGVIESPASLAGQLESKGIR